MTIQIELSPDMEAKLASGAEIHGIPLESYAQQLLQEAIASRSAPRPRDTREEFLVFLDALAGKAPNVPQLRVETFSREMIYGDHA